MHEPIISVEVQQLMNYVALKILRAEKKYTLYITKTLLLVQQTV